MKMRLQRKSILSVLLAIFLAFGIAGLSTMFLKSNAVAAEEEKDPSYTIYIGGGGVNQPNKNIYYYDDFERGWEQVVTRAADVYATDRTRTAYVKAVLMTDWVADAEDGFGTGEYFSNGRIVAPANTNITIDLAGYKIDRNLSAAVEDGHIIQVVGSLTVTDSKEGGVLTGGYNKIASGASYVFGGGIYVSGGTFTLRGGSIEGNRVEGTGAIGIGVTVVSGGTFNMYGGSIRNHEYTKAANSFGGGVAVYMSGLFNMYGGVIENNTVAKGGGGVCVFNATSLSMHMEGGIIRNNHVNSATNTSGGGGIMIYNRGSADIVGGEICNNTAKTSYYHTAASACVYGGGIFLYGGGEATSTLNVGGSVRIHDNIVNTATISADGAAIAVRKGSNNNAIILNLNISGGEIYNNLSAAPNTRDASGGGVYAYGCTFTMTGGDIHNNRAASFQAGDTEGNLDDLVDGGRTYGGGVFIYKPSWAGCPGVIKLQGGSIRDNRANSGGGINGSGDIEITGGTISGNYAPWGGAIYADAYSTIALSGRPVIENNYSTLDETDGEKTPCNLQVAASDGRRPNIVGPLEDGARIHVSVNESLIRDGKPFTQNYGANNSKVVTVDGTAETLTAYANPYRYFISDTVYAADGTGVSTTKSEQHIMVLNDGELGVARKSIKFVVTYSDASTKEFVFGEQFEGMPEWNYIESNYKDTAYPVNIKAYVNGNQVGETKTVEQKAGIYTLSAQPSDGKAAAEFSVVVQSQKLTDDDVKPEVLSITLSGVDDLKYNGSAQTPSEITVTLGGVKLNQGEDYEISYENNTNAGTATVIISFKGNYSGEVRATYTIGTSESGSTQVKWEVNLGSGWVSFAEGAYNSTFTYNESDQSGKIRAILTASDGTKAVYAEGIKGDNDIAQNTSMKLVFTKSGSVVAFKDAGTYSIKVDGSPNYPISEGDETITGVEIAKMQLSISASDFNNTDASSNQLWLLQVGPVSDNIRTYLLKNATYIVDGKEEKGESEVDYFARFRDKELSIIFNPLYLIDGYSLEFWYTRMTVSYSHAGNDTAVINKKNIVTTTITITFGDNYEVGTDNTITIVKEWAIVTITNHLLTTAGKEITTSDLQGWTFGNMGGDLKGFAFRPEHGTTMIYAYYMDGATEPVEFAVVYSDDTSKAARRFYTVVDGEVGELINDEQYLYSFNFDLKAGSYRVVITVPRGSLNEGSHTHWFEKDQESEDYGVIYYEFSYEFAFTVNAYALSDGGALNAGIEYYIPANSTVEYNDKIENNCIHTIEITLNGKLLVEGEDYTLSTTDVEVGLARLIITGINSLTGNYTILGAYQIVRATNGWEKVPSIMYWTYNGFMTEVNLVTAVPYFGVNGLWFEIKDSQKNGIEGLDHITVDAEGHVTDEKVIKILKGLDRGNYYLYAYVDGTDNWAGLENSILFSVFQATNRWETTPSVNAWIQGEYVSPKENLLVKPEFGDAHIKIVGSDGTVYYDSDAGIDKLAEAKHGFYTLTAWVDASDNFSELYEYRFDFEIFKQPGLPWWATLLIAVGSLMVAALIIFILWKKGVFQILTEKLFVSIKTRASVEATIASVRAAKMMEEGRRSVEEAKRRERLEQMRKKAQEERELSPEERAAKLEAKAQADAEKAEKLRKRSEAAQKRAEKMLKAQGITPAENEEKQNPETPTEE